MHRSHHAYFRLVVAAALAISARPALAAWSHDPLNGNLAVCAAAGNQQLPAITSDGAGGAIVTWQDPRGGNNDIYAQRVSAAGAPLWTADGVVVCSTPADQINPTIASDGAGGAIITWADFRNGIYNVFAQRLNAAGVAQWTANGVAVCTALLETHPNVVADGAGGAIVAWQDNRTEVDFDIYAQRLNAAGVAQWTANGVALCTATGDQFSPIPISDGAGGAIVTWQDNRAGTNETHVYVQRVSAAGAAQWTANGVAINSTTPDPQILPAMLGDGAGGAIISWADERGLGYDIYVQRVNSAGALQWASGGVALTNLSGDQTAPGIVSDGFGGAIVAWQDNHPGNYDVYAQRVNSSGAPQWTAGGVALSVQPGDQAGAIPVSDGAGGVIVTWQDSRNGNNDVFAQRVNAAGATQWAANGIPVCTAANDQLAPMTIADGSGGAIVAWYDNRGASADIYAQRIEHFGYLGNPEPVIASVKDVPNDQGGSVKVAWYASWLDGASDPNLASYDLYRSTPGSVAAAAVKLGAHTLDGFAEVPSMTGRSFVIPPASTQLYAWEYVGSVTPVHFLSAYGFNAATTGDSIGGSNPPTIFMVVGRNAEGSMYWLSAPDSGYSVDNLPPLVPAPFTGAYVAGATHLHWGENHEADLVGYRLYRGASSGFVPGPGNLVSAQTDTGYADVGAPGNWYKLSAIDIHGNESPYALVGPNSTLDAPGSGATALTFAPPSPNPASRDGATFRFGLPATAHVTLMLFDQQGRRVRELVAGAQGAGEHAVPWDLRDDTGRPVQAGLYFARLTFAGRTLVRRIAALR